ncbi:MAG TPA: nucleotidyl transferase AbiEii/AbiGii toxin family protein, partial [Phycisphaerae bacterium]|nr:nucleotidyl transferase AbiEii/AbiGii toxin family protein [Phycisphaerae bacterium]
MPTVTRDEMLEPLAAPLRDLVTWLSGGRIPFVIIGGVAASLQGEARFTGDIDAVVMTDESKLEEFLKDAKLHGFSPRRADPIGFARANRIVLLVHDADAMNVDLSLGILPFEQEMIERAVRVSELGMEIPIAAPEELIAMKVLAFRG